MLNLLDDHVSQWEQINQLLLKQRLPQSLLLVGPRHAHILQFVNRLIAILICEKTDKPCMQCRACHLLIQGIHPDIKYIRSEGASAAIKVEQVRELQQDIYQTPQRGARRFIVIESTHNLNISAANALLKILEEPPLHTMFILIAEQLNSIPATILSRCQKYNFYSQDHRPVDYLSIGQYYSPESPRAELFQQSATIITQLCELMEGKLSPCTLAERWSTYALDDLLWLVYLLTAQAIHYQLVQTTIMPRGNEPLMYLARLTTPVNLLNQLRQINAITEKINHNINMNQTLVLEDLLLSYLTHLS